MAEPLKNMVDDGVVRDIADRAKAARSDFDAAAFTADLMRQLPDLELKPRIEAISRRLRSGIDDGYLGALETVVAIAEQQPAIEGFAAWPLCTFVEIFGLDHPAQSLAAMEILTQRASCEFAIRPYLRDHWDQAYAVLEEFTGHQSAAVRRLASEGTRPRLPWGTNVGRLTEDPEPGLALLERLRHDPDEAVRRSVANHLNDVSKTRPELVVETANRWQQEPQTDPRLLSHALRTLVKRGDKGALAALGYTTKPDLSVEQFTVGPRRVGMGDYLVLEAVLWSQATASQRLVVDFVIHHVTKSGGTTPKVFKWKTVELPAGKAITLTKRRLIQMATTRRYYPGKHLVELQIAGTVAASGEFEIVV